MPDPSLRIGQKFAPFGYAKDSTPMVSALDPAVQATVSSQNPVTQMGGATSTVTAAPATAATNDGVPPGTPSTPIVKSMISGIQVTWDGYDNTGQLMPADFARLEVHTSTTAGFTPSAATLATVLTSPTGGSAILVTGYTLTYVVFLAYDSFGNVSSTSQQASGQGNQVSGPDLAANSVTTNTIAAGAVTATQIAAGAITADKIGTGTLTVGTKITLGNVANSQSRVEIDTQSSGTYGPGIRLISRSAGGVDTFNVVLDNSTGVGAITSANITGSTIIGGVIATASTGARVELGSGGGRSSSWGGIGGGTATGSVGIFNGSEDASHPLSLKSGAFGASNSIRGVINSPSFGTSTSAGFSQILLQGALSTAPTTGKGMIGLVGDHVYVRGPILDGTTGSGVDFQGNEVWATDNMAVVNASITTDASGNFTVTHGLGWTPVAVMIFIRATGGFAGFAFGTGSYTGTTFAGRMSGATSIQSAVPITWVAFRVL